MKNKSKIIVIVLVIVVLVAAGLVAWLLLGNGEKDKTTKPTDDTTSQDGGKSTDLASVVRGLPGQSAIEQLFTEYLRGFWTTSGNKFVVFGYADGVASFDSSLWDSDAGESGEITATRATGEYKAELTVHFPAVPPNYISSDGSPEKTETIEIIVSGITSDGGHIRIKRENGHWAQYDFSGRTFDEAYARTH